MSDVTNTTATATTSGLPTSVSLRDLAFVREVLIPRVAWLRGDEIDELLRVRQRLDAIFETISGDQSPRGKAAGVKEEPPC